MDINIILVCYNESILLPHAVKHYKKYLPSCNITIYDNQSTDDSVEIAKQLGCTCIDWDTQNRIDDYKLQYLKNNCWKNIQNGWIIMADMDEFLCVTEDDLIREMKLGTSILNVIGYDMIGESKTIYLTDIELQNIKKGVKNICLNKNICFMREKITDINYGIGAHSCNPIGDIKYSSNTYIMKHMNFLGINYIINKLNNRYLRSEEMRKNGLAVHYTNNNEEIINRYNDCLNNSIYIDDFYQII